MNDIVELSLFDLDLNDGFFDSLRDDYPNFNEWFLNKRDNGYKCYVTFNNGKISSFLLFKLEDENEDYSLFSREMFRKSRLKICSFKVDDVGKGIGKKFIKVVFGKAYELGVDEIYITVFDKYREFISFLERYGFKYYCENKNKERVYIKLIR